MRNLNGKRVLITGAGHGLGRALAERFAAAGAEIVVTDVNPAGVAETTAILRARGQTAVGYTMDVTDPQDVRDVRARLHDDHGPIDMLINNAGYVHGGKFLDLPLEQHRKTYEINTFGPVVVTHGFLPDLIARDEGQLVFIGSAAGLIPLPYATTYASSKSAVYGFSESIREELRVTGNQHVRVMAVCPSYLSTGLFKGVHPPRFARMLTPENISDKVYKSVLRGRELVLAPWIVNLIPIGNALLPRSLARRLLDWLRVTGGMRDWHGHTENSQQQAQTGDQRNTSASKRRSQRR